MAKLIDVTDIGAADYLFSTLAHSKGFNSSAVVSKFENSEILALVPSSAEQASVLQFEVGGLTSVKTQEIHLKAGRMVLKETREVEHALAMFVREYLDNFDGAFALFENIVARPADPWLARSPIEHFFSSDDCVYFYVHGRKRSVDEIIATIRASASYLIVGGLGQGWPAIRANQIVTNEVVTQLQERLDHLIVSAYDGEGFLIATAPRPEAQ